MSLTQPLDEYRRLLAMYLRPQRSRVSLLAVLLFGSVIVQLGQPQIIRYFIDTTQRRGDSNLLIYAGLAFIAISLLSHLLTIATTRLSISIGWRATNTLRVALTAHLLRLDLSFYKTHTPGELIERVDGDINELAAFFAEVILHLIISGLLILGVLIFLSAENILSGLALAGYCLISVAALIVFQGVGVRRWAAARQAAADQFGYIEERLSGVEDLQGSGSTAYALARLFPFTRRTLYARRAAEMVEAGSAGIGRLLFGLGWALGLGIGAALYAQQQITIGTVFLIIAYINLLAGPLDSLREQARTLQRTTASLHRITALFHTQPIVPAAGRAKLPSGALAVEFDQVSFAYAENAAEAGETGELTGSGLILHEISFRLTAGRVLGVLGRTGSGKTTLTRLLFRFYAPSQGAIRLGNRDLADVGLGELRARVGLVTQEVQLFSASLRDNITFFDRTVDDARIMAALDALDLRDWLGTMPQGLDTRLAAGGAGMSAGEAQLLAFTRLLLRDPGLIVLDEAASRLDPITEQRLERAVNHLLHGPDQPRSAIIIAHRLSTVQRADDILILDGGRMVEYGPRAQLTANPDSRFSRLLQTGGAEVLA